MTTNATTKKGSKRDSAMAKDTKGKGDKKGNAAPKGDDKGAVTPKGNKASALPVDKGGKASSNAKPADLPEVVGKIIVARVKEDLLRKTAVELNIENAATLSLPDLIAAVQDHYNDRTKYKESDLADCNGENGCMGAADARLDYCTFCGDSSVVQGPALDEGNEEEEDDNSEEGGEEGIDEGGESDGDKPDNKKGTKGSKKSKDKGGEKKKAGRPKKNALATSGNAALSADEDKVPDGVTVDMLDTAIKGVFAGVAEMDRNVSGSSWDIGSKLLEILDKQLWKARVGEDGKPKYKSLNAFCRDELEWSTTHVYNLADVAKTYTRQQCVDIGMTKLSLILKAPADKQPALLTKAADPKVSKRDIEAEVAKVKPEGVKRKTGRKETPAGVPGSKKDKKGQGKKANAEKKGEVITVSKILGQHTVMLFKKPSDPKLTPTEHARLITDEPVGWRELQPGVREYFQVLEGADGKLTIKITIKREDPAK